MDSLDDPVVRSAAADVSLQRFFDGGGCGRWVFSKERNAGEDHAGRAVAALHGVAIDEALLDRVKVRALGEAFNGGDFLATGGAELDLAGARGSAVKQDGAGPALPFSAAVFCSCQLEVVAEDK